MTSTIAKDTELDADQEYDNLDEDQISLNLPPPYKTATRLHTNIQDNVIDADEPLQELPTYDEIDDSKTASSPPTYETATKLTTNSLNATKGTSDSSCMIIVAWSKGPC